jgi:TRAP-type C4-dicarboxylate transport system substrate-binding protein
MIDAALLFPHPISALHLWMHTVTAIGLALATLIGSAQPVAPQAPGSAPALHLRIVGGLAGTNQYTHNEEPFWSQELVRLSNGNYSAEIVPFDRAGVPGGDMLRLLQLGVVPFGTTLQSSLLMQYPQYAANDLAGLNPDMPSLKKVVTAFRPYLEHELRTKHNVQMLGLYVYPAQVIFCKQPFARLADLKGRRVRVSSASQSDFLGALGAVPVTTGFAQIMANMASGNIDCAVTGTMSGNTLGLHEVTSHLHTMPLTWGLAFFAANKNAWDNLPSDLKALLSRELPRLEAAIWAESARETTEGLACNVGAADCRTGRKGKMTQVLLSPQDDQLRQEIFSNTVLPRWLARCGPVCRDVWNQTIGPVSGIAAKAAP